MTGKNISEFILDLYYNSEIEFTYEQSAVICFGEPFKEMGGNIIAVDYRSSRKVVR